MLNVSVYGGPSRKRLAFVCNQTLEEVLTDFKSSKLLLSDKTSYL